MSFYQDLYNGWTEACVNNFGAPLTINCIFPGAIGHLVAENRQPLVLVEDETPVRLFRFSYDYRRVQSEPYTIN